MLYQHTSCIYFSNTPPFSENDTKTMKLVFRLLPTTTHLPLRFFLFPLLTASLKQLCYNIFSVYITRESVYKLFFFWSIIIAQLGQQLLFFQLFKVKLL
eukprot:sb/3478606/